MRSTAVGIADCLSRTLAAALKLILYGQAINCLFSIGPVFQKDKVWLSLKPFLDLFVGLKADKDPSK